MEQRADGVHINAPAGEIMARSQRHEPRAGRQFALDKLRSDTTRFLWSQMTNFHALRGQSHPRIDVRGVIVLITDNLVACAPGNSVGEKAQSQRCRAKEGDLGLVRADQIAHTFLVLSMSRSTSPNS